MLDHKDMGLGSLCLSQAGHLAYPTRSLATIPSKVGCRQFNLSASVVKHHASKQPTKVQHHELPFRFLDLPGEIRNMIYRLLLSGLVGRGYDKGTKNAVMTISTTWGDRGGRPQLASIAACRIHGGLTTGLLSVNRQVGREAVSFLYTRNLFDFFTMDGLLHFCHLIGPVNTAYLRYIRTHHGDLCGWTGRYEEGVGHRAVEFKKIDAHVSAFAGLTGLRELRLQWKPWVRCVDPKLAAHFMYFCARDWLEMVGEEKGDMEATARRVVVTGTHRYGGLPYNKSQYMKEMRRWLRLLLEASPNSTRLGLEEVINTDMAVTAWERQLQLKFDEAAATEAEA